ncbi:MULTISPECIES: hypothetical protein [Vagococcus]|uniref:hypothetical protein n=1 Tax=Vagococcus TaxID=2737 RepID=UPI000E49F604|nr:MULTISPECIES: hypothetical protein [Vagococcus]RHH70102.1 hypothetical protein DW196_04880 [Vagococcus sp. AM17-17]
MILTLKEAQVIDENITQNDLDAYEQMVRQLTSNNFQNKNIRFFKLLFEGTNKILLGSSVLGLRVGDTIQVSESRYNDGLFVVSEVGNDYIECESANFFNLEVKEAFITKIEYPADIKQGVESLIKYQKKMGGKVGIKSESIARMSTTYYDVNANDNSQGFPAAKMDFLKKYEKMRWG